MLPGWSRQACGDELELRSPRAVVRYVDGLAPIVRFAALAPGPAARFVTREGEHAAVAATASGARAVVLGDYHYARLDVTAAHDAIAIARELAAQVSFGLGTRRRRIWYQQPAGWLGLARGLGSEWFAPGAPRGGASIRIYPAAPARLAPDEVAAAIVDEQRGGGDDVEVLERLDRPTGVLLRTRVGAHAWRDWSIERVHGYQYTVRLEAIDPDLLAAARPAFEALVASIERVPSATAAAATVLDHWLD